MKKLLFSIVSTIFILVACSKTDLRVQGFVTNNKGVPIENVNISIQKSKKRFETTTDKTGYYRFENVPSGIWEFTVSKEGYKTQSETYSISGGSSGNVFTKNFELIVFAPSTLQSYFPHPLVFCAHWQPPVRVHRIQTFH